LQQNQVSAPIGAASSAKTAKVADLPVSGDAPPLNPQGPWRSNKTLPYVVAALKRPGGVTLAELTKASGWLADFEMKHLRTAANKCGFEFADDGAKGADRRYSLVAK
jgi:hypothetical protein